MAVDHLLLSLMSVFCITMSSCATSPKATFEVLSVNHESGKRGMYFNFDIEVIDQILGRTDWANERFPITNMRTGQTVRYVIWRNANGGSHSGHGRKDDGHQQEGDFRVGDILLFSLIDKLWTMQTLETLQQKMTEMESAMKRISTDLESIKKLLSNTHHDSDATVEVIRFRKWMEETVKLPQYIGMLIEHGFDDIESLGEATEDHLKSIGIDKLGHRIKIIRLAKEFCLATEGGENERAKFV